MHTMLNIKRLLVVCVVALASLSGAGLAPGVAGAAECPNEARRVEQHATLLPDCRAYEMVSPADKNGGDVSADSTRTRAAADGSGVGFTSLSAFGDAVGTGIATDYFAERQPGASAGNGWVTHAITPPQSADTYLGVLNAFEPLYVGEFSPDLRFGVFSAFSPLTADPFVQGAFNLYRRSDVLSPGAGSYGLVTACPACAQGAGPLSVPPQANEAVGYRPILAGMSADGGRVLFESRQPLTADTPVVADRVQLFEWDQSGGVQLVGRVPSGGASSCDDVSGPACVPADVSIAGQGAGANNGNNPPNLPNILSDGSDGHSRVIFTRPTDDGVTPNPGGFAGQLFMRVDGHATVEVSASERSTADSFAPARYWDASADGARVFFTSPQALTNDAPVNTVGKLYMYDVNAPAGHQLSFLGEAEAVIGASAHGHMIYFIGPSQKQLVPGAPKLAESGIFLWREGVLSYVGPATTLTAQTELWSTGIALGLAPRQARVTPDGTHLLFSAFSGAGLTGYDHGGCVLAITVKPGCRELYVYSADQSFPAAPHVVCVSCRPDGVAAASMATDVIRTGQGSAQLTWHQTHTMSDDGSRVFFSTADPLVPEDVNGKVDVYEYDVPTNTVKLISSGTSPDDSWFLDASADGSNVFFVTRQQLVGWDHDQAYDLYDARIGGGFPEPVSTPACATADTCNGGTPPVPAAPDVGSDLFHGAGNVVALPPKPPVARCRKGYVRRRVHGKLKCVKRKPSRRTAKKRHAGAGRVRS